MKCVIIGAGGHSKVIIDSIKDSDYEIIGLTDNALEYGTNILGCKVIGKDDALEQLHLEGVDNAFMGIGHVGYPDIRNKVFHKVEQMGYRFPALINKSSYIGANIDIGDGTYVGANAVINAESKIGELCIINTSSVIEHEACIENGVHIAPNATVLGGAYVGENTFVGAGSVILQGVKIGKNCIIGAGSVVLGDIADGCVAVGVPAKIIKRR